MARWSCEMSKAEIISKIALLEKELDEYQEQLYEVVIQEEAKALEFELGKTVIELKSGMSVKRFVVSDLAFHLKHRKTNTTKEIMVQQLRKDNTASEKYKYVFASDSFRVVGKLQYGTANKILEG